jgi:hypothetical protein
VVALTTPTSPTSPSPTGQPIEQHPDILDLRARYERAATNPGIQGAEALAILAGLYLAISPWVAGFNHFSTLSVNNLITGIGYAMLMGGFGSAYERTHAMAWAATLIGAWTVVSPWVVAGSVHTTRTIVNNCVTGGVATCLGLMVVGVAMSGRQGSHLTGRSRR